jgi:hypothetical protein
MTQPFNYTLNVPNPAEAVTSGLQQGVQLAGLMERADLTAAQRQQTLLENQALRAKAQLQAQQQAAVKAFYDLPSNLRTADEYERISATLPKEQAENIRASFEAKTKEQQRQELLFGGQIFAALRSGDRETANSMLLQKADAARNGGDGAQAKAYENAAEMAAIAPDQAELFIGTTLAALPGGKDFINSVAAQSEMRTSEAMAPGKIAKAIADGKTAEIIAATEQKMRDAEIAMKKAQTDSARASAGASYASAKRTLRDIQHIDAMEPGQVALLAAQTQSELAEAAKKRGEGGAAGVLDAGQRVLDTVALIRGDVKDKEGKTVKVGDFKTLANVAGPIRSKFPTTSPESADTENAIKTLNDQVFLQQIKNMKGMGALSEKEGDRLAASVASLNLAQSPERLQKNIQYIEETTRKAMEKMQSMAGGSTGAAAPAAGSITLPSGFKYSVGGQ